MGFFLSRRVFEHAGRGSAVFSESRLAASIRTLAAASRAGVALRGECEPGSVRCGAQSQVRFDSGVSKTKNAPCWVRFVLEAPPRIELGVKVLQTSALPLGYGAV